MIISTTRGARDDRGARGPVRAAGSVLVAMAMLLAACSSSDTGPGYIPEQTIMNTEGKVIIVGEAIVGETLTAEVSDPDGTGSTAFQWSADASDIPDATMSTFTLTEGEIGQMLTVSVRYTDAAGFLETLTSTPTPAVAAERNVEGSIDIEGVPTVGKTLTASISDGNGLDNAMPMYTWFSNGAEIANASGETYVVRMGDIDANISVSATYTDDAGFTESVTSAAVGPISATAVNVPGTITLSATAVVGVSVVADVQDSNGITMPVTYQWFADNVEIPNATSDTYVPTRGGARRHLERRGGVRRRRWIR